MNTDNIVNASALAILLTACSAASMERAPNSDSAESSGGPMDTTATSTGAVSAATAPSASSAAQPPPAKVHAAKVVRVPEDVLRDPLQLMTLMQQVRQQIVYKTKNIAEPEYEQVVRPSLVSQLRAAGFTDPDVDEVLSDVDYSRGLQGLR